MFVPDSLWSYRRTSILRSAKLSNEKTFVVYELSAKVFWSEHFCSGGRTFVLCDQQSTKGYYSCFVSEQKLPATTTPHSHFQFRLLRLHINPHPMACVYICECIKCVHFFGTLHKYYIVFQSVPARFHFFLMRLHLLSVFQVPAIRHSEPAADASLVRCPQTSSLPIEPRPGHQHPGGGGQMSQAAQGTVAVLLLHPHLYLHSSNW